MRIVFFGTPVFAVASLQSLLHDRFTVAGVVTQPDKPQGRSRSELIPPPVKIAALAAGIPVLQPVRPMGDVFAASLRRLEPDLGVVVAYGHILRPDILSVPPRGMINVHASLLPRLRGAAPIQHAILAGDRETGISIMQMEEGLDSGPVLHRVVTPIGPDETAGALAGRLADLGAAALVEAISLCSSGLARPEPQDHANATYAPKLDREQARLVWQRDAAALVRQIRAFDPAPGAWTDLNGSTLKLFGAKVAPGSGGPGTVLETGGRLVVAAGSGAVAVSEVQPAGKTRIPVEAWLRGRGVAVGQRLT
jgi:methionyl-tRNA formyltransferase